VTVPTENRRLPWPPAFRAAGGFTLVELMIVVAIIAVLASIAYPMYREQTREARRSAGLAALSDMAARQEQFFLDRKVYTQAMDATGLNRPTTTDGGHYLLSVDAPTGGCPINRCYALTAAGQGDQANDTCATLTLSSDGTRGPAGCW